MKSNRPVNLNLFTISLPLAGIVSFSHRVTGIVLFFGIAFGLYALQIALRSPEGFVEAGALIATPFGRVVMIGLIFTLSFHFVAGLKHLMLDFHIGDTVSAAQTGAIVTIVLTLILTALLGALLW